jgi:hypothetical protein
MKKIVLTIACAALGAVGAMAQGNVNWSTISPASMTAQTNSSAFSPLFGGGASVGTVGAAGGAASLGTGYYYELLYQVSGSQLSSPTTLSALSSWSDTTLEASNSTTAGRLTPINGNAGATVPWSPGTSASVMLVGWSANLGSTWSAVSAELQNGTFGSVLGGANGFFGESNTGYLTTLSTSTSPGTTLFGSAAIAQGTPIFSTNTQLFLLPTPEPGTMALAALGGLSMLAFRRKK